VTVRQRAIVSSCLVACSLAAGVTVGAHAAQRPHAAADFRLAGPKITETHVNGPGFGSAVALSSSGRIALVSDAGGAWFFAREGARWGQQGPLITTPGEPPTIPGSGSYSGFGSAIALSGDGSTALISAPVLGSVWAFARQGTRWVEQGPALTSSDQLLGCGSGGFGASLALSANGRIALVGDNLGDCGAGAVWAFTRSGTAWTKGVKLVPSDAVGGQEYFGDSVALSANGDTALIGGPNDRPDSPNPPSSGKGAVWVFTRTGTQWTQAGPKITLPHETGEDGFGFLVALSADGRTALIDATNRTWAITSRGASTITPGNERLTMLPIAVAGNSLALSANGRVALVGDQVLGAYGGALVFTTSTSGGTFAQRPQLLGPGNLSGERAVTFGTSVALSASGDTALVGDTAFDLRGAVWTFSRSP